MSGEKFGLDDKMSDEEGGKLTGEFMVEEYIDVN